MTKSEDRSGCCHRALRAIGGEQWRQKQDPGMYRDQRLAVDFRNLAAAYGRLVLSGDQRGSLGGELKALLRADLSYRVKVSDLYRSHKWLPRPIGKLVRRNAAAWVRSIGTLPTCLGLPGLVVLFDETEQTLSLQKMSKKNRQVHLANLRNLVDHLALGSFQGASSTTPLLRNFSRLPEVNWTPCGRGSNVFVWPAGACCGTRGPSGWIWTS